MHMRNIRLQQGQTFAEIADELDRPLGTVLTWMRRALQELRDMAVLVRGRTQLASLLPRLRAAGIDYQAVDIDRLTDLPDIIELLALTRAMVHPCDRLA